MKKTVYFVLLCLAIISCSEPTHLIKDVEFREHVENRFEERKSSILNNRSEALLTVLDKELTAEEQEAIKFIYAYAPLCDLADYSGEFYLESVKAALESRTAFEWSKTVPSDLFLNFVLPLRSSNENIDNYRTTFFNELKGRIEGKSMMEAALEVNHWCHEKVTYKGTDIRTMSPLNTMKTAFGRCGEESVFAVAAYRAVGIPARQVYTPRWAHSDDNHAWIEVWVDGTWYFTGACEPAPKMNMGWFSGPAGKAILTRASSFGELPNQDKLSEFTGYFTYINNTSNYTATEEVEIVVVDKDGAAVEGAEVGFTLYNYAEMYPVTTLTTDKDGKCSETLGLGDILIWVTNGDIFTYKKISVKDAKESGERSFKIVLEQKPLTEYSYNFDMVPPVESIPYSIDVTKEERDSNNLRQKSENGIRKEYESTFISQEASDKVAEKLNIDKDKTFKFLKQSRSNSSAVIEFLESVPTEKIEYAFKYLDVISYKDLWDTPSDILISHFKNATAKSDDYSVDFYIENIVNPRITNEILKPYKEELREQFKGYSASDIVTWIKDNLTISEKENSYRMPLSPWGTYELKYCDSRSRDLFFVATCRSIGIPSRLNSATQEPEFFDNSIWQPVSFSKEEISSDKGTLLITNNEDNPLVPVYYKSFTIARLVGGTYKTLAFDKGKATLDFPEGINLGDGDVEIDVPVGNYMMISGNRLKDGSVLTKAKFFNITAGKKSTVVVDIRKDEKPLEVIGSVDVTKPILKFTRESSKQLKEYLGDKGTIVAWLEPDREPTKHFMLDIKTLSSSFEEWGGNMIFCLPKDKASQSFFSSPFPIPSQARYAVDDDILKDVESSLSKKLKGDYPVIVILNKKGEIVFENSGYRIGIGEQLLKTLEKLNR